MLAANCLLREDQLLCCICLDVFTRPVTLPCGHNFCRDCIMQHLGFNSRHQCPVCKESVDRRYKPVVNTFVSEMALHFRQAVGKRDGNVPEPQVPQPGAVSGEAGGRMKPLDLQFYLCAVLVSLCLSCCFAVVVFHLSASSLNPSRLLHTPENAADSVCPQHKQPLELYCTDDQTSICRSCAASAHSFHHIVSLEEEHEARKGALQRTKAKVKDMIRERRLKVLDIKRSVRLSEEAADRETTDGVQVFAALIQSLRKGQSELIHMIRQKQGEREKQAQDIVQEMEKESSELQRRHAELEHLEHSDNHLHFLQHFPSLIDVPATKDWSRVTVCPGSFEGVTRGAVVRAFGELTQTVQHQMTLWREAEQRKMQQAAVEVTLDPASAHPALILSTDGKQVRCTDTWWRQLPDNPERLESAMMVLGRQSFSCGRFHFDTQVGGKTSWTLGVAMGSLNRKWEGELRPDRGYWAISLRDGQQYVALAGQPVPLAVDVPPQTLRVFVDFNQGLVSFYDVDAALLLYSFTDCSFTEKLYPLFSPGLPEGGRNSAPLIITPVSH